MRIEALPIDPPDGNFCFAFRLTNDSDQPILEVHVDSVHYEWGDSGHSERVDAHFGPIAPGQSVELMREIQTEVRTSISLRVVDAAGVRQVSAEFGRLYVSRGPRLATLE